MATQFQCDPDLASRSSSTLAGVKGQIPSPGDWIDGVEETGVPDLQGTLGDFSEAASAAVNDLTTHVGGASQLLGSLAQGSTEVDESLLGDLGLLD